MSITPKYFQIEEEGPIAIWKFNNPPKNLWNMDIDKEFVDIVEKFYENPALRVGMLTSALPDVFIQHFDSSILADWSERRKAKSPSTTPKPVILPEARGIYRLGPKPTIAVIHAPLAGGGLEVAMAFTFRFMSRIAWAAQPEVNLGILAGDGGTQRMPRLIGVAKALELQLTGRAVSGDEAERIGLVTKACDPHLLMKEAMSFARGLAAKPPLAVQNIMRSICEGMEKNLQDGINHEAMLFRQLLDSDEALQRIKKYVEGGQDFKKVIM
jgi:enoyl-CoA hydratase